APRKFRRASVLALAAFLLLAAGGVTAWRLGLMAPADAGPPPGPQVLVTPGPAPVDQPPGPPPTPVVVPPPPPPPAVPPPPPPPTRRRAPAPTPEDRHGPL